MTRWFADLGQAVRSATEKPRAASSSAGRGHSLLECGNLLPKSRILDEQIVATRAAHCPDGSDAERDEEDEQANHGRELCHASPGILSPIPARPSGQGSGVSHCFYAWMNIEEGVCPAKVGMFSGSESQRGKSQRPVARGKTGSYSKGLQWRGGGNRLIRIILTGVIGTLRTRCSPSWATAPWRGVIQHTFILCCHLRLVLKGLAG